MKQLRVACCVLTAVFVVGACGDDEAGIREGASSGMLADSAVVAALRSSDTTGRIIYDPAPELSLASAQQKRPDMFRPPAAAVAKK